MAIGDDVLASTLEVIRDDVMDSLYVGLPLLQAFSKGGIAPVEQQDGGRRLIVPIEVRDHTTGTDLISESSVIPLEFNEVLEDASYVWSHNVQPVFIGVKTKAENSGQAAQVSVLETRLKRAMESQRYGLSSKMVSNAGSLFSELTTLNGFTASGAGVSTGIFEPGAFNSTVQDNVVGGISKATYPLWQHQYATAGGAWGTGGLTALDLMIGDCQQYAPQGRWKPFGLMSRSGWGNLRRSLRAVGFYESGSGEDVKEFGYGKLIYNGVPIDYDTQLTGGSSASTTDIPTIFVLNLECIKLYCLKTAWFELHPWTSGMFGGFAGEGTYMHTAVALAPNHLASSGVIVNGDTF